MLEFPISFSAFFITMKICYNRRTRTPNETRHHQTIGLIFFNIFVWLILVLIRFLSRHPLSREYGESEFVDENNWHDFGKINSKWRRIISIQDRFSCEKKILIIWWSLIVFFFFCLFHPILLNKHWPLSSSFVLRTTH